MEDFVNDKIETAGLPRFEEVELTPLHSSYLKIVWFNIAVIFGIIAIGAGAAFYFIDNLQPYRIIAGVVYAVILLFTIAICYVSFRNKGFAFRTHDVIYRSGAIAVTTTIIPYNRVQHAAVHEGWLSRKLGLATIEIFTAGGLGSDIKVPGIEKEHAGKIRQLLMGKILNNEPDEQ